MEISSVDQERAMRSANFFLLTSIIETVAASNGQERDTFMRKMRQLALNHLEAARLDAADRDPLDAEAAALTRALIGAAFDVASSRHLTDQPPTRC
jgi:hypothetical protein